MIYNNLKFSMLFTLTALLFTACDSDNATFITDEEANLTANTELQSISEINDFLEDNGIADYKRFVFEDKFYNVEEDITKKDFEYIKASLETASESILHDDDGEKSIFILFKENLSPDALQNYIETRKRSYDYTSNSLSHKSKKPYRYTFFFQGKSEFGGKGTSIFSFWGKTRNVPCHKYNEIFESRSFGKKSDMLSSFYGDFKFVSSGTFCGAGTSLISKLDFYDNHNFAKPIGGGFLVPGFTAHGFTYKEWTNCNGDLSKKGVPANNRANSVTIKVTIKDFL